MYCRMCGKLLDDTDQHCKYCGTATGFQEIPAEPKQPMEEEVVFNPPYESEERHNSFLLKEEETQIEEKAEENLKEFISENEVEEQKRQAGAIDESTARNTEFSWNVHEFPQKKKTEDVEFSWKLDEYGHQEQKAKDAVFEEELFQEIRDEGNRIKESNIDRFFTFSKKNEEFQELLDKEYEKINRHPEIVTRAEHKQAIEAGISQDGMQNKEAAPAEVVVVKEEVPEEISETVGTETDANPEVIIEVDSEIEEPEEVSDTDITEAEMPKETDSLPESVLQVTIAATSKAEHLQEMAQARTSFFGEELIQDNETIKKKLGSSEAVEEKMQEKEQTDTSDHEEANDLTAKSQESERKEIETPHALANEEARVKAGSEKEKKNPHIGMILLMIIGIILVFEIAILGIRYFAPNSEAADMINTTQAKLTGTVSGWFSISDNDSGKDSINETEKQKDKEELSDAETQTQDAEANTPAPDKAPMADKAALVATQLGSNVNIQQVKANDTLAFQEGRDYGLADLNQSKPIANNIWMTPQGEDPVYYDRSIVGAIIAFDSQWIDYVSGTNKNILDLLKKDSGAYEKTVSYSKIGKVKEIFKLLEIGEIRQGSQGFYVWVHEEIQLTENGKTTDKKYNWVYYLEPVEGKMNIVNYFNLK